MGFDSQSHPNLVVVSYVFFFPKKVHRIVNTNFRFCFLINSFLAYCWWTLLENEIYSINILQVPLIIDKGIIRPIYLYRVSEVVYLLITAPIITCQLRRSSTSLWLRFTLRSIIIWQQTRSPRKQKLGK